MNSENVVVEEVVSYFSTPRFERLSVKREDEIQFGSRTGYADVALLDDKAHRVAIIECKKVGYEGNGIEQLKSYLSATNTVLGGFANSTDPDDWYFCENLGANRFREITRSRFEARVLKLGVIGTFRHFLRRLFHRKKSDIPPDHDQDPPRNQQRQIMPNIPYIGGAPTVQNEFSDNSEIITTGNEDPYYSQQNGFKQASVDLGIANCIPQHVRCIIHNEELEIALTREEIDREIERLRAEAPKLESEKREAEQEAEKHIQDLANKKEQLAGLEVQLGAPTEIELTPTTEDDDQTNAQPRIPMWRRILREIFNDRNFTTLFCVCVGLFLYFFYASAVHKAFFLNEEAIRAAVQTEGEYTGIRDIVNPSAVEESLTTQNRNWVVLLFPFIFLGLAKLLDYLFECARDSQIRDRRIIGKAGLIVLVIGTFVFDAILALSISENIHTARDEIAKLRGDPSIGEWGVNPIAFWTWDRAIFAVLFCGFATAIFFSGLCYITARKWKTAAGRTVSTSKKADVRKEKITAEKVQRDAIIAQLKISMENLENKIRNLNEKIQIAQRNIDEGLNKISELSARRNRRVLNRNKMESHINQFLNGWCQWLAQSGAEESEIGKAREVAYETLNNSLDNYYTPLT